MPAGKSSLLPRVADERAEEPFVPKSKAEQRIAHLIAKGPLTEQESDDLYRALHADYMRKWRIARADRQAMRRMSLELVRRGG